MKLPFFIALVFWASSCTTLQPKPQKDSRQGVLPQAPERRPRSGRLSQNKGIKKLLSMARSNAREGKYREATSFVERAYRIDHKDPYVSLEMSKLLWALGDDIQAEHWAQKSIGLWSKYHYKERREAWYIIYQCRLRRGDYEGANKAIRNSNR